MHSYLQAHTATQALHPAARMDLAVEFPGTEPH